VTFVINSMAGGGAERIVALLLRRFHTELDEAFGFATSLVLLDAEPFAYELTPAVHIDRLAAAGSLPRSVRRLYAHLRRTRPAVVVAHLARANFAAVIACSLLGIPCLVMEHVNTSSHFHSGSLRHRTSRFLVRRLYPRADRVIAVSEGVAADLAARHGVDRARVETIPTPFDLAHIRAQARAAPEIELPARFLVAVGRLTENKNFAMLLRAYARAEVDAELVVLGEGEALGELRDLARALGIAGRVHFPGFARNPYAVVARAAAFVSSSNAEGFPVAASEAMILGRPVLMTDCPSGPAELVGGRAPPGAGVVAGAYGLLTPLGDVDAMAAALPRLLEPTAAARAEAGRARMEAFELARVARLHARCIREVLAARSRPATAAAVPPGAVPPGAADR
jgi:N-acetylgalactosamine-N,N'-diacetylbacillosaminyl-diphospho-undecaprenol 4-alpha-N-acetylgalactosaminyltransferase